MSRTSPTDCLTIATGISAIAALAGLAIFPPLALIASCVTVGTALGRIESSKLSY
jgi:hypothetical protein